MYYGRGFGRGGGWGFGRGGGWGFGRGGGWGFGFRGSSPPWPFIGLGRGGLPRCGYFLGGATWSPPAWNYPAVPASYPWQSPYPYDMPQMSGEQELDFLKDQAEAIKHQLDQINSRIQELGKQGG